MSKARDISNLFSASTSAATDAEVTSAIATHASNTTNRHYKAGNSASRPASPNAGDIYSNTQTNFVEIYNGTTWEQVGGIASTPTGVTATNQGSGRAFNNGQASVAFTPGTIVGSSYTVTSSPGSYTNTGASSPVVITGLQSNTAYTYIVTATNNYGTSPSSTASAAVTATTVPQAPSVSAVAAFESADLTITPAATGGSAITQYSITSTPATTTQTTSNATYNFTGLTAGTSYTFSVVAVNTNGNSTASAASNSVTPFAGIPDSDFWALATSTVTDTSTSTVTISNIPTGYKHLQLRWLASNNDGSVDGNVVIRFNGDTGSNYSWRNTFAISGSPNTGSPANQGNSSSSATSLSLARATANGAGTLFGCGITDIVDYSSTSKNKNIISAYGNSRGANSTSNQYVFAGGGSWNNTAAITSISFINTTSNFGVNSKFALYGYK